LKTKKIVVKFGGSNLKQKEDISKLISVVDRYSNNGRQVIIVISALYGVTDILVKAIQEVKTDEKAISGLKENLLDAHCRIVDLYIGNGDSKQGHVVRHKINKRVEELEKYLRGIHYLGEIPDFVEDRVLSYGERLSSLVLTSILDFKGIPCRERLPENLGLLTNGEYRNATVDFSLSQEEVERSLSGENICVIPGFYGMSRDSKVTLFGRGGSDYTAAAIARCIDAESVDLWKDVPGFMSADPKLVKNPTVVRHLAYDEAAELSYFGARIIHPRTFEPVTEKKIPIRLFNINDFSEDLEPVTVIRDEGIVRDDVIKSVTFSDDFGILRLHGAGVGIKPGIMAKVASTLNDARINIKSIITSQTSINILLSRHDLGKSKKIVKSIGLSVVDNIEFIDGISVIAVVGHGILERPGIAARVFSAVAHHNINIRMISAGASNVATYFIIDKNEKEKAVKSIHDEFFPACKDLIDKGFWRSRNLFPQKRFLAAGGK
jgi:aspartate kinase/aspartokinase/homoserine dehydrogenase 1